MTTLFIITFIALCVSLYFTWRCWEAAKFWHGKYLLEKRARGIDNIISGVVCGAALFVSWITRPRS